MNTRFFPSLFLVALMLAMPSPLAAQETQQGTPPPEKSAMVGDTEVTWTDGWRHSQDNSSPNLVTLLFVDSDTGGFSLITYSQVTYEGVDNSEAVLASFVASLAQSDFDNIEQTDEGELGPGSLWRLFGFELQGLALSMLIMVEEVGSSTFELSTITTMSTEFAGFVERAQNDILLNGEPAFLRDIDPAALALPDATPPVWPGDD